MTRFQLHQAALPVSRESSSCSKEPPRRRSAALGHRCLLGKRETNLARMRDSALAPAQRRSIICPHSKGLVLLKHFSESKSGVFLHHPDVSIASSREAALAKRCWVVTSRNCFAKASGRRSTALGVTDNEEDLLPTTRRLGLSSRGAAKERQGIAEPSPRGLQTLLRWWSGQLGRC